MCSKGAIRCATAELHKFGQAEAIRHRVSACAAGAAPTHSGSKNTARSAVCEATPRAGAGRTTQTAAVLHFLRVSPSRPSSCPLRLSAALRPCVPLCFFRCEAGLPPPQQSSRQQARTRTDTGAFECRDRH